MTIKVLLGTLLAIALICMTDAIEVQNNTITQQRALINSMTSNKACMADPRPEPLPTPKPSASTGRHDDNLTVGRRTAWRT